MESLIWIGTALSIAGLAGLLWCIARVWRARRSNLSDQDLRDAVRRVVPWNMGALLLSAFGLIMVITGIMLG
ncbi:hypothetical protein [Roseovarius sp. D22-M7]|uniref:hypothetical protein n=1 Tax=Roseovarius sp. D22-M7 TaxID=3127116 RepID=UPI0030102F8D